MCQPNVPLGVTESDPIPNDHIHAIVASAQSLTSSVSTHTEDTRTELDSHANMCVFGEDCFIFEWSGKRCSVTPFTDTLGKANDIPICDVAVAYDSIIGDEPETFILIARNALVVPGMSNNLLPPFILRQAGHTVNECPKFQQRDPSITDHSILLNDDEADIHIPLQLNGIFSFFHTRTPSTDELHGCRKVLLTPDGESWNPYCPSFELNEQSMTTFQGDITHPSRQERLVMTPDFDDDIVVSTATLNTHVDNVMEEAFATPDPDIDNYDLDSDFAFHLTQRADISKMMATLGSTTASFNTFQDDTFTGQLDDLTAELIKNLGPDSVDKVKASIASVHASSAKGVSKETLSKIWMVTEDLAQGAIDHNTQLCKQQGENNLSRNYSTNDRMLRYKRLKSTFYTDTLFAKTTKSLRQNVCAQLFVSDKGFVAIYPMRSQTQYNDALHWFCKQVGVPHTLVMDAHKAQSNLEAKKFYNKVGTTLRILEEGSPWSNRAELYIGLFKEAVRKDLRKSDSPMVLWDYCMERRALIHNSIPRKLFQANGLSPHEITLGAEGDISNLCTFDWYDWVYYRNNSSSFPMNKELLGRVLGPIKNEGNEMAQAVLTSKGTVVTRRSVRSLSKAELVSDVEKHKRSIFNAAIKSKLGDSVTKPSKPIPTDFVPYSDGNLDPITVDDIIEDPIDSDGTSVFEKPVSDHLIHAELSLPQGEYMQLAKVIGRTRNDDGTTEGMYDNDPLLNTLIYDVQFPDGTVKNYAANVIAENMYSQVDADGHAHALLDSIQGHRKDANAVHLKDKHIYTKSGQRRTRKSTAGWQLLIAWKNGSEEWIPLSIMKQSNPCDVAEYAESVGIAHEPAFSWWVPYTLRKRDRIISAVNARVKRVSHKYGIEIPRSITHAYEIDSQNNNTLWRDALDKEMGNLKVAFDILEKDEHLPVGWTKASGHLIFDVRMTLERKARWVKDGHRTPEPENSTFAGVVSRESVRIALTYSALMGLDVCACDIQNAFLQAPSSEKHYIICGPEFGLENVGKRAKIIRALYGGKSAGADYWRHVRRAMDEMGFTSCKADPDIWFRPALKADGVEYYQYVLLYCDDILAIMEDPERFIREELDARFVVKPKSIGQPTQYLGNKVSQVTMENSTNAWSFSSSQYVQSAVKNVETHLAKTGESLPNRATSPWTRDYRPESDTSAELNSKDATYFQSLIGILRWIVELGRIDITMETSALASMMALPRRGHLDQVFHMFAFLKAKHNGCMVFDPTDPDIDASQFVREDWSAAAYGECREEVPTNMPEPRGVAFTIRAFVDSDHAGDVTTRRSRTGFIIFLNSAPIYWSSKKQTSVETSSFGSEFLAMKACCEYIRGLRYKLRMMGIPVEGPSYIFGDNQSVLSNTSKPHSTLKKKSSSIAFHFVREGTAKDEWRTTYINTHFNIADLLTKSLPGGEKRTRFTSYVLHYSS